MNPVQNILTLAQQGGILSYGASQYIATIEQARKQLADNQILYIGKLAADTEEEAIFIHLIERKNQFKIVVSPNIDTGEVTEIYLPKTVEEIGENWMDGGMNIVHVDFPKSLKKIGNYACVAWVNYPEDLVLPDGLKEIGINAFAGFAYTSQKSIIIPETVTTIEQDAFMDVPHIYYNGSATGAPWGAQAMN